MKLNEIRRIPVLSSEFTREAGDIDPKLHESVFRSFHIVEKVVELLKKRTPPEIIIEIIEDLKDAPIPDTDRTGIVNNG